MGTTIKTERLDFQVPEGFADETAYAFQDGESTEKLEVILENVEPGTTSAKIVDDRRDSLSLGLGDAMRVDHVEKCELGSLAGTCLTFTIREKGVASKHWLAAAITERKAVVIAYDATSVATAQGTLASILNSVSIDDAVVPAQTTPDGFTRRQAGRVALDVPTKLLSPRVFLLAADSGATRLVVNLWFDAPHQSLNEEIAKDESRGGEIHGRNDSSREIADSPASVVEYEITEASKRGGHTYIVKHAEVRVASDLTIRIRGRTIEKWASTLTRGWSELLSSIKVH